MGAVTTPDGADESPRDAVARNATETYAEFASYADDPELPERTREFAQASPASTPTWAPGVVGQDIRMAEQEQHTADLEAILIGDDMIALAAALKPRLTPEQLADLIVGLDGPA